MTDNTLTGTVSKRTQNTVFVIVSIVVAVFGSIIGMQLIAQLGVTPNTSIIGVLIAMIIARIPLGWFKQFRSMESQNLIQTTISSATFGAANSLLLPIGIPYAMGLPQLVWPLLIGSGIALAIDVFIFYRVFDSRFFSANESWPSGVATAEAMKAGDQGGKKAWLLGAGIVLGLIGSSLGISMSAFGVAFIGNIWALAFFGIGLVVNGYAEPWFGIDINALYIPHGMMIGAGLVALLQFVFMMINAGRKKKQGATQQSATQDAAKAESVKGVGRTEATRSESDVRKAFLTGNVLFMAGALILALLGGLISHMSPLVIVGFVIFAGVITFCHEIIVGIAAMHSGWFPAFAVTLISLMLGLLLGFPPVALALLTGYVAASGPAFADMGYDFKTGALIRRGVSVQEEIYGRRQQLKAGIVGFVVAFVVVAIAHDTLFSQGLIPPVDKVFATTIEHGIGGEVGRQLLIWAIPGAIVQLIGGPKRQVGIMFATGLLIVNPLAGWAVLVGIVLRFIILKIWGEKGEAMSFTLAAGFIAGDALYSFFSSLWKAR
jgi:uncharacterized oligopeptide transporter (OPT) family protein